MKKYMAILLLSSLFSCRKSENLNRITGNWELRKIEGGFAGTINYPVGNGHIYSFTSDGIFAFSDKGVVYDNGTYTLSPVIFTHNLYLKLKSTRNNYEATDSITINGNELVFLPKIECCDIPATIYEKLSN